MNAQNKSFTISFVKVTKAKRLALEVFRNEVVGEILGPRKEKVGESLGYDVNRNLRIYLELLGA